MLLTVLYLTVILRWLMDNTRFFFFAPILRIGPGLFFSDIHSYYVHSLIRGLDILSEQLDDTRH